MTFSLNAKQDFKTSRDFNTSVKFTAATLIGAKVLSKVATKVMAKVGSKVALSGSSSLGGVVCGPFAPLCAVGIGTATWFGVDIAVAKSEEKLSRDEFEAKIYNDLMVQKDEFKENIFSELDALFSEILDEIYKVEK